MVLINTSRKATKNDRAWHLCILELQIANLKSRSSVFVIKVKLLTKVIPRNSNRSWYFFSWPIQRLDSYPWMTMNELRTIFWKLKMTNLFISTQRFHNIVLTAKYEFDDFNNAYGVVWTILALLKLKINNYSVLLCLKTFFI